MYTQRQWDRIRRQAAAAILDLVDGDDRAARLIALQLVQQDLDQDTRVAIARLIPSELV